VKKQRTNHKSQKNHEIIRVASQRPLEVGRPCKRGSNSKKKNPVPKETRGDTGDPKDSKNPRKTTKKEEK